MHTYLMTLHVGAWSTRRQGLLLQQRRVGGGVYWVGGGGGQRTSADRGRPVYVGLYSS